MHARKSYDMQKKFNFPPNLSCSAYCEYIGFISRMVTPMVQKTVRHVENDRQYCEESIDAEISKLDRKLNYFMYMSIAPITWHIRFNPLSHTFDF
jgi:hypothetical protein